MNIKNIHRNIQTWLVLYSALTAAVTASLNKDSLSTTIELAAMPPTAALEDRSMNFCNFWSNMKGKIDCVDDAKRFCFVNEGCPFPRIPESPEEAKTSFLLFTSSQEHPLPRHGKRFYLTSNFSELIPDFNSSAPLFFIIHGWG